MVKDNDGTEATDDLGNEGEPRVPLPESSFTKETTKELAAQLNRPIFETALRQAGLNEADIQAWLQHLSRVRLSDEKLALLIGRAARTSQASPTLGQQFSMWRHKASHLLNHKKLSDRLIYTSSWLVLLVGATAKAGLGVWGYLSAAVVLAFKAKSLWKELDPAHLPMLQRTLAERQLLLHKLLHETQTWRRCPPTEREVSTFQKNALRLIATYVRDHRSDLKGRNIFVSLLVSEGDRIVVLARSDAKRPLLQSYRVDECSVSWAAISTGIPHSTGDVYRDAPNTPMGKPYKSILALPICLENQILGAVSVDSGEPYHFEGHEEELEIQLAPYVQLLAVTLVRRVAEDLPKDDDHGTSSTGIGALPPGSEEKLNEPDAQDQRSRS